MEEMEEMDEMDDIYRRLLTKPKSEWSIWDEYLWNSCNSKQDKDQETKDKENLLDYLENLLLLEDHNFSLSKTNGTNRLKLSIDVKHDLHVHGFVFVADSFDALYELVKEENITADDCEWSD